LQRKSNYKIKAKGRPQLTTTYIFINMKNKLKMAMLVGALSAVVFAGPLFTQAATLPPSVQQDMNSLLSSTAVALNSLSVQLSADNQILLNSAQTLNILGASVTALNNSFQQLDEDDQELLEDEMQTVIVLSIDVVENEGDKIRAVQERRQEQSSLLSKIIDSFRELVEDVANFRAS
jgi:hypothetical protein